MADLLECLIQIKGVADTPRRLAVRSAAFVAAAGATADAERTVRDVAARLADAEAVFRDCLSMMLAAESPMLPPLPAGRAAARSPLTAEEARADFASRRADTVRVLERCTAGQLNRVGIEPARGRMIVADLVALMLAHDTDSLGDLTPPR